MAKTFASLCGGFRLADVGAMQAGYEPIWDVELDPKIAEIGSQLPGKTIVGSVTEVDWMKVDRPDVLWASPPCPNFSIAKANASETSLDMAIAESIVDALKTLLPPTFILENVEGYKNSKSLQFIEGALYALGYWIDRQILNAADFGVPQTRRRLILRAVLGGFPQPLPPAEKWKGWYQAIEDLIPTLPESEFAQWQLDRLPYELMNMLFQSGNPNGNRKEKFRRWHYPAPTVCATESPFKAFLVDGKNARSYEKGGMTVCEQDNPVFTLMASTSPGRYRAFLCDGVGNNHGQSVTIVDRDTPSFTVKASAAKQASRAWLEHGRVVRMTPRALARFQTLPDWYELPEKAALACRGIGNGVPCLLAQKILEAV